MQDIFDALAGLLPAEYLAYATAAVTLCSVLDAALPQPSAESSWYWPRRLISLIAVNVGHAVNARTAPPDRTNPPGTVLSALFAVLLVAAVALPLGACTAAMDAQIDAAKAGVIEPAVDRGYDNTVGALCKMPASTQRRAVVDRKTMTTRALRDMCPDWESLISRALSDSAR